MTNEILEATGLAGIADALHGATDDKEVTVAGFSGDAAMGNLADGLATHFGLNVSQNTFVQNAVYTGTKYVILEAAEYCFDGLGGFTSGSSVGFSIAQLKVE